MRNSTPLADGAVGDANGDGGAEEDDKERGGDGQAPDETGCAARLEGEEERGEGGDGQDQAEENGIALGVSWGSWGGQRGTTAPGESCACSGARAFMGELWGAVLNESLNGARGGIGGAAGRGIGGS